MSLLIAGSLPLFGCSKKAETPAPQAASTPPASNGFMAAHDIPTANDLLDQYEKVVVSIESIKGAFTIDNMNAINKANIDFASKFQAWQTSGGQMSAEQMKRLSDLQTRQAHAMEKANAQPSN